MTVEPPLAAALMRHDRQTPEVVGEAIVAAIAAASGAWPPPLPLPSSVDVVTTWLARSLAPQAVASLVIPRFLNFVDPQRIKNWWDVQDLNLPACVGKPSLLDP